MHESDQFRNRPLNEKLAKEGEHKLRYFETPSEPSYKKGDHETALLWFKKRGDVLASDMPTTPSHSSVL